MMYFYNPTKNERSSESLIWRQYGLTPETADAAGWKPLNLTPPAFDKTFHYIRDTGNTVPNGNGGYDVEWVLEYRPVEQIRKDLKAKLADIRFKVETDGVDASGTVILTDRLSQGSVTGALALSNLNPATEIDWKGKDGWVKITHAEIQGIAALVGGHVQQCFSKERHYSELIDAAANGDELKAINLNEGWPATAGVNSAAVADMFDPMRRF